MGNDLTLYVMDEHTTPWSIVSSTKLARHYPDQDRLYALKPERVPTEAIPSSLGPEDGFGALEFVRAGRLPELPGGGGSEGSPFNQEVVAEVKRRSRPEQPVILWGH